MRTGYSRVDPKELIGTVPCDQLGFGHDFYDYGDGARCQECNSTIDWEEQQEAAAEQEAERRAEAVWDDWTI